MKVLFITTMETTASQNLVMDFLPLVSANYKYHQSCYEANRKSVTSANINSTTPSDSSDPKSE